MPFVLFGFFGILLQLSLVLLVIQAVLEILNTNGVQFLILIYKLVNMDTIYCWSGLSNTREMQI